MDDLRGNAQVEGRVVRLSLLKSKRSDSSIYFDGLLSDNQQPIRFVGFSEEMHQNIERFHHTGDTVLTKNCNLHKGKYDKELQLFINSGKLLSTSQMWFMMLSLQTLFKAKNPRIFLEEITSLQKYSKVDLKAKVITVKSPITVGQDLNKKF